MSRNERRAFRPVAEGIEDRLLTTGGLAFHLPAVAHGIAAEAVRPRGNRAASWPPGPPPIGPGLDGGLVRLALPYNYRDYGVVTIWNNTSGTVTFGVGANTYNHGQLYSFTLPPGTNQSFYAPRVGNPLPVFGVSFGPGAPLIRLPKDNVIFEVNGYVPAGTAGFPYAINFGSRGYSLSYI